MIATERHIVCNLDYSALFEEFATQKAGRKKRTIDLNRDRLILYYSNSLTGL